MVGDCPTKMDTAQRRQVVGELLLEMASVGRRLWTAETRHPAVELGA